MTWYASKQEDSFFSVSLSVSVSLSLSRAREPARQVDNLAQVYGCTHAQTNSPPPPPAPARRGNVYLQLQQIGIDILQRRAAKRDRLRVAKTEERSRQAKEQADKDHRLLKDVLRSADLQAQVPTPQRESLFLATHRTAVRSLI